MEKKNSISMLCRTNKAKPF